MTDDIEIIVNFSILLSGPELCIDSLRSTFALIGEVSISTELEASVDYGPTRNWRSLPTIILRVLDLLAKERGGIRFEKAEASILIASPVVDTWMLDPEVIVALAAIGSRVFVRILDTSKQSNEE